jgi:hypothetical protein
MYLAGEWKNIWNRSFTNGTDERLIFSEIIFPLNNQTLQFCHTYNLQEHHLLNKVTFKLCLIVLQSLCIILNSESSRATIAANYEKKYVERQEEGIALRKKARCHVNSDRFKKEDEDSKDRVIQDSVNKRTTNKVD